MLKLFIVCLLITGLFADEPLIKEVSEKNINYRLVADKKTITWSTRLKLFDSNIWEYSGRIGSVNLIYSIHNKIDTNEYKDLVTTDIRILYYYKF
jgi:hypothetical protein